METPGLPRSANRLPANSFKTPSIKMLHTRLGSHLTRKKSVREDLETSLIQMVNSRIRFGFREALLQVAPSGKDLIFEVDMKGVK